MKRMPRAVHASMILLPLFMMTACSEPEAHVAKINLINDLGTRAELSLCKDDLHCESISELWPPKRINAKDSQSFVVSNEEMTVLKVSSEINGKKVARCLRIRLVKPLKPTYDVLLSSATDC